MSQTAIGREGETGTERQKSKYWHLKEIDEEEEESRGD